MDDSNSGSVWLGARPTGHVRLNVNRAARTPGTSSNPESETKAPAARKRDRKPAVRESPEDIHPLLLLYPFDPPPGIPENEEALEAANGRKGWMPEPGRQSTTAPVLDDLGSFPDVRANSNSPEDAMAKGSRVLAAPEFHKHSGRLQKRNPARQRVPRERGGLRHFRDRYGFLFTIVLLCDAGCSYQAAKAYRQMMALKTSALTLTPAVFLLLLLPALLAVFLLRDQRHEVVAISMLVAGGLYGLLGIGCKVAMLLAQA